MARADLQRWSKIAGLLMAAGITLAGCQPMAYGTYDPYLDPKTAVPLQMPTTAPPISQQFAAPLSSREAGHFGIDIMAAEGLPVLAPAAGVVTRVFSDAAYGNQIEIEHGRDAGGTHVRTAYKHLAGQDVASGQRVRRGQQIGTLGGTGFLGIYPHLHFELHRGPDADTTKPVDPHRFWAAGTGKVTCYSPRRHWPRDPGKLTYPAPCGKP